MAAGTTLTAVTSWEIRFTEFVPEPFQVSAIIDRDRVRIGLDGEAVELTLQPVRPVIRR